MRSLMCLLKIALFGCSMTQFAHARLLIGGPSSITLPSEPGHFVVLDDSGGAVKFKSNGVGTLFNEPNFLVVIPSSGTTPAMVRIGLNPSVVAQFKPESIYSLTLGFTTVGQTPESSIGINIRYLGPKEPPPGIRSVVNAASLQPFLAPGALVSILGSYLTGPTISTDYDYSASYPTSVANTTVTFNGIAAPLLYLSPNQINAIVPYAVAGQKTVQVVVQRFDMVSAPFTLPMQDTSPGIFTATQTGSGQGAILQQGSDRQFTYNNADNPAPIGAALEIFATGAGGWTPPALTDVFIDGAFFKTQPVSVTIGGQPARVLYAGSLATQSSWSVLQVNAVVPDGIGSGPQQVVLKIGVNDNSQQKVTVWVK